MDTTAAGRASHERDFLEELQRQRDEVARRRSPFTAAGARGRGRGGRRRRGSSGRSASRSHRAPPTTYDADDLEIPSFLRRK